MATRRKKQPVIEVQHIAPREKCYIVTTSALYVNNYVIRGASSQEEAEWMFQILKDNEEEGDPVVLQQLQYEDILQIKEAM